MDIILEGRPRSNVYHKIYCEYWGLDTIPEGYCIHHIDENPWNNDITNLYMMTLGEHSRLHHTGNTYCLGRILSQETKDKMKNSHMGKHVGDLNGNYREITSEMLKDYLLGITQSAFVRKYTINPRKFKELKLNIEYYINKFL